MANETVSASYDEPDRGLIRVTMWYWHIHPYASLVVCCFGIITNVFNILILTRKKMKSSTNCILTGIAVSDLCLMVCYLPFVIHFYIMTDLTPSARRYSLRWTQFLMFHGNFTAVLQTASIWLAVYLAGFRHFFLSMSARRTRCFQIRSTCRSVSVIFILSVLIMCPNFVTTKMEPQVIATNETVYRFRDMGIGTKNPNPISLGMFWIYGVVGKIIPSILIAIFGGMLLKTLFVAKQRRNSLITSRGNQRSRQHKSTTLMLLIIIVLYLITQLPHGVLVLLCCLVEGFFQNVYMPLGDIMDIVALVNNAVNFVLYCSMSHQFRKSFIELIPKYEIKKKGYTQDLELISQTRTRFCTM